MAPAISAPVPIRQKCGVTEGMACLDSATGHPGMLWPWFLGSAI